MVRDGFINIYGAIVEDYAEGDPLPCPCCGKSGTAEVIRTLETRPTGFRLRCMECGYQVPPDFTVYNYFSDEGIKDAIDAWNSLSMLNNDDSEYQEQG